MERIKFTFDDVLAIQCCMETAKKVQEDEALYNQLLNLHDRIYDAYHDGESQEEITKKEMIEKACATMESLMSFYKIDRDIMFRISKDVRKAMEEDVCTK